MIYFNCYELNKELICVDFQPLKDFMNRLTDWRIPGNTARVFIDNKEVFRYNSGFSDIENNIKMTDYRTFFIYSCSKIATATAAMQLYEKGIFLLDDPIYEYLPEYKEMEVFENGKIVKADKPITFRHLFTMTAGLSYEKGRDFMEKLDKISGGKMDNRSFAKVLSERPLSFQPGEHWQYSFCHDLLSSVIEVISGMKFRDYVRKNIFVPLGMTQSSYHLTPEIESRLAVQYNFVDDTNETDIVKLQQTDRSSMGGHVERLANKNPHILGPEFDSGGAGIITTADDYIKLVSALANKGEGASGARILSSESVELMKQNQLGSELLKDLAWPQLKGYGYGLGVRTMIDKAAGGSLSPIGEFGWGGAAGATVLCDTDRRLALFYTHHMCNPQETYYQPRLRNVLYSCLD